MFIKTFEVRSFRNHEASRIDPCGGVNVIAGENGSGKTNLLEGIFLFASGKSFRGQKDREAIMFGRESAYLKLVFEDRFGSHTLETTLFKNRKRLLVKDGCEIKKISEYLGLFRAVVFTPDHLRIVKSSPENRRRLIDLAICQSFPRFVASLSEYNRILLQKNNLLKAGITELSEPMLDIYNEKLAALSAVITLNRFNYVARLEKKSAEFLAEMTDGAETLELSYSCGYGREKDGMTREKLAESCLALFERKREDEKLRRISLCGCHHDDFSISINGKDARLYASQGQQRSAVLSLKLAEGELSKQYTGEDCVFLFDDVLSELDESRRSYVTGKLGGRQVLITGCEPSAAGKTFAVAHGSVSETGES